MKALIHHTTDDLEKSREILCWLAILLDQGADELAVVTHGESINLYTKDWARDRTRTLIDGEEAAAAADRGEWSTAFLTAESTWEEKFHDLMEQGVMFKGCETALADRNLEPADMVEGLDIVPSGITEVNRLQADGFTYATK